MIITHDENLVKIEIGTVSFVIDIYSPNWNKAFTSEDYDQFLKIPEVEAFFKDRALNVLRMEINKLQSETANKVEILNNVIDNIQRMDVK